MTRSSFTRKHPSNRQGAAAVEFAMVVPLLLLLLFMMIESSRYLMSLHALAGAAREANRIFAIQRDESIARNTAIEFMRRSSFDSRSITVEFTESNANVPNFDVFTCRVSIDYADVSLVNDPFSLGTSEIVGFSSMLASDF